MQKNEAYGAYTVSTSENDYDIVQARTQVDSDLPANNKAVSSSQQKLPLWCFTCVTMVVALLALIIVSVVAAILTVTAMRNNSDHDHDIQMLQNQLSNSIQNLQAQLRNSNILYNYNNQMLQNQLSNSNQIVQNLQLQLRNLSIQYNGELSSQKEELNSIQNGICILTAN